MEEILIVSNYYPPEKGAAANRIEQLALKLTQHGYSVSVLCPLGNYPEGRLFPEYRGKFSASEQREGVKVNRLWIYPSNSKNLFKRLLSVFSFSKILFLRLLFGKLPEKVIVQSPPLLLSFLSVLALRIRRRKIILNVSDLWPMAAIELRVMRPGSFAHRIALQLERFLYRHATVLLGQSDEILAHVQTIVPAARVFLYRNFPDHKLQLSLRDSGEAERLSQSNDHTIKMFYAGLLGVAQGVLESCEKMELAQTDIEFHIFGDGAERNQIQAYIEAHPEKNIVFHGMVERRALHARLEEFDLAYVPLATRIYGSVPSKIFEYGALGIPIVYFGGGEGEEIVREHALGWVAEVGNFAGLNRTLEQISKMGKTTLLEKKSGILSTAEKQFDLDRQMRGLIEKGVF